jgi:AcrR family transcriptional regulator
MPTQSKPQPDGASVRRSPRERLLAAADELFYAEGVQSVGIDRVIERAGVAKASLYSTFGSKEELVRAYLEGMHERVLNRARRAVEEAGDDPLEQILAVFDAQASRFRRPEFHGCAFVMASAEARPHGGIDLATESYRADLRGLFVELSRNAGADDPEALASQLHMLYDGANLSVRLDGDPEIASAERAAAATLVAAARAA